MIYYDNKVHWYKTFNEAYLDMMGILLEHGHKVHPRPDSSLGATREILNACFAIPATAPLCTLAERGMSYAFALLEPFFLFTTQDEGHTLEALSTYAPQLKALTLNPETGRADGNYGDRIHLVGGYPANSVGFRGLHATPNQLIRCYNVLKSDPSSRRAVLTIHNPVWDIVDGNSKDICCSQSLQFLIRDNRLHCFCTMRSNDIWYGTVHNVAMFSLLQRAMAGWLDLEPGDYVHRATSLHIYEKMIPKAQELLANPTTLPLSPYILYPQHASPEVTYARARKMIEWEYEERTLIPHSWEPEETYEALTAKYITEYLAKHRTASNTLPS